MESSLPLKWHGGKHYLAEKIIARMPAHKHYVEPFFGSGAVLFAKPNYLIEGHSEVINDIYYELSQFYIVLQDKELFPQFQRIIEVTPFSQLEWEFAGMATDYDPVKKAVKFFVRYRQSRQGLGKNFATLSRSRKRRGMNEQVASWLSAVEGLEEAHERLQRVVILCDHALNVMAVEDSQHTFFYLDPPYLSETRTAKKAYLHEMTTEEHEMLLSLLTRCKGKFLLSGYPNALYDRVAKRNNWNVCDIVIDNKSSSSETKELKTERLWSNY